MNNPRDDILLYSLSSSCQKKELSALQIYHTLSPYGHWSFYFDFACLVEIRAISVLKSNIIITVIKFKNLIFHLIYLHVSVGWKKKGTFGKVQTTEENKHFSAAGSPLRIVSTRPSFCYAEEVVAVEV
ncbi:hypothetical protein CDAR_581561 [Caerostris darwini]|uniref:Uncharacterized protein n=1 Tax=Caerostris darwini TaxID=1538125 RepID=A0AAV4X873_9ARAC|nr:hypothetical protein CDAR_581561 [Caerostris darwini]